MISCTACSIVESSCCASAEEGLIFFVVELFGGLEDVDRVVRDALKVADEVQKAARFVRVACGHRAAGEREKIGAKMVFIAGRCCLPVSGCVSPSAGFADRKRIDREIQCLGGLLRHARAPQRGSAPRRWPGVVIRRVVEHGVGALFGRFCPGRPRWRAFPEDRLRA